MLDVGADLLAEIGDLVDEGDLGRKKRVRGIFGQLGGAATRLQDRRVVQVKRPVEFAHDLRSAFVLRADDDAVRPLEVGDGAFAQEFRVGDDGEVRFRAGLADEALDLIAGADRHRPFGDDDRIAGERPGDVARCLIDIGKIGVAVAAPRRVPTAMNTASAAPTAALRSPVKVRRFARTFVSTRASRPGS
jgi:hypothetical protein